MKFENLILLGVFLSGIVALIDFQWLFQIKMFEIPSILKEKTDNEWIK